MKRLEQIARSSPVDVFVATAETAELSEDFFPSGYNFSSPDMVPPSRFYMLVAMGYMQMGDFAMAEAALLRWHGQLVEAKAMPPPQRPPRVVTEPPTAVVCLGLLTVCRQSLRHFYDVAFHKMALLTLGGLQEQGPSSPPGGDGAETQVVSVMATAAAAEDAESVDVVLAYAEACLDSLAARFVRLRSSLYASKDADEEAGLASQLNIPPEEMKRRLEADEARKVARVTAREAVLAKSVETSSLVDAALRVSTFA